MTLSLTVLLIAFALVLPVELPDKTLVATMLLAARYRPLPVFVGVCCAFAVQCVIAVAFGGLLTLLPPRVVAAVVTLLFAGGAAVLLREGFGPHRAAAPDGPPGAAEPDGTGATAGVDDAGGVHGAGVDGASNVNGLHGSGGIADATRPAVARSSRRIAITAFGVLFVAEFGDASQLATAALTARYGAPLSVGLGAWLALVSVAAIAVLIGKRVGDRLPRHLFQRVAGGVFAVLALLAATEVATG